ncbi:phosphoribosylaminoimidazolesuccinocarboxamide synthase [Nibribacter ruber]|uniref:Phosphoribosylaminoimidazole-succinocarboxamide synthase n=1 Tax=Nibribacter ruber TaxID=2698458 RepID=A0A6P1NS88_9BACT|nr:phosphoribosylaminoimidazolesuccinocarboxamide synthase [Nibribacter ruber]QHL86696.1 phosphoribosylaminoimidazolesuccinocarboxamide synthase [Nibribacter ruber]
MQALKETHFHFPEQTGFYRGKVRDVYYFQDKLALVATDRISAFDVVLPRAIPFKGQVLNQIAAKFLEATKDVVPNWVISHPAPNVTIGKQCETYKVEMVIRGYLAGHAWREYSAGKRTVCNVSLPEGLKENDRLPEPIITPTTKAAEGHDEDISREEIIQQGIVSEDEYLQLESYTRALFQKGTELAAERGLILVDTKYEFGKADGVIYVIDEIHTPDSSRFFYSEGYQERQDANQPQRQLSKEFVRQWLIEQGFQGKDGQQVPEMTDEKVAEISQRYIELYEQVLGETFSPQPYAQDLEALQKSIASNIF